MPLSDIATIVVTAAGAGVTRAGYGVPLIVSHSAAWPERFRVYLSLTAVGVDFPVNSPEYLAADSVFAQSPKVPRIMIGRAANVPNQRFALGVPTGAALLNTPYVARVAVPTGVVFPSQDATYNPGAGATVWSPSNTWSRGDLVANDSGKLYSCLGVSGPSGANNILGSFTGIGGASGPSGIAAAIQEGNIWWMFTGSGNTGGVNNDSVINGLKAKVDALLSPPPVGTGINQLSSTLQGSQGSRTLRLLANTPGKFFGMQVRNRAALSIAQDHADPGIVADLNAIKLSSNAWYGLITLFNSEALVDAAASFAESATKQYDAASLDSAICTVPASRATDVAADIKAAAYARTWVFHHPSNDEFADAAEMGKFFPYSPGSETWRMKTLNSVTVEAYTDNEIQNKKDKFVHYYYDIGGRFVVGGEAKNGAGEFIDTVRFLDWYTSELQAKLADLEIALPKVPFTNPGIDLVEAKVTAQNTAGIRAGGIRPGTAVVTAPDVANISTQDKTARELAGVVSTFELAGAIHHITVSVTASA